MNILMVLIPISPRGISAGVRISSAAVPSAAARTSPARCQTPQFSRPSRAAAPEHHDPPGGPKEPGNHKGIIAVNHRGFIFGFIFGYIYMWINIYIYGISCGTIYGYKRICGRLKLLRYSYSHFFTNKP